MDTRNVGEYLRQSRPGQKYTLEDIKKKAFRSVASSKTATIYLPRILQGKLLILKECDFKGELIPDGMVLTKKVERKSICSGINSLGKLFKVTDIYSRDPTCDIETRELNKKEVPNGRDKPSSSSREELQEAPSVAESNNPR